MDFPPPGFVVPDFPPPHPDFGPRHPVFGTPPGFSPGFSPNFSDALRRAQPYAGATGPYSRPRPGRYARPTGAAARGFEPQHVQQHAPSANGVFAKALRRAHNEAERPPRFQPPPYFDEPPPPHFSI